MAAICAGLVGVLPTGGKPATHIPAGGMDPPAYPEVLLAAVAQPGREGAPAKEPGAAEAHAQGSAQFTRSLASGWEREPANGAFQREATTSWLSDAIQSGEKLRNACFNRRLRKTARPVVWEGGEAQSPSPDPIELCRLPAIGKSKWHWARLPAPRTCPTLRFL
jgi:hypothetical protein